MLPTQFRHISFTSHKICISALRLRNNPVNKATNIPMMFTVWLWTIKTRHSQRFLERFFFFFFFLNVFIRAFICIPIRLWKNRAKKKKKVLQFQQPGSLKPENENKAERGAFIPVQTGSTKTLSTPFPLFPLIMTFANFDERGQTIWDESHPPACWFCANVSTSHGAPAEFTPAEETCWL